MTGPEIIEWAMNRCKQENRPPHDGALIQMIREETRDVSQWPAQKEPQG